MITGGIIDKKKTRKEGKKVANFQPKTKMM
jgi:hypothetical protein